MTDTKTDGNDTKTAGHKLLIELNKLGVITIPATGRAIEIADAFLYNHAAEARREALREATEAAMIVDVVKELPQRGQRTMRTRITDAIEQLGDDHENNKTNN